MSELNPNHPVTREVHDHWHKIVGILMRHIGITEFDVTAESILDLDKSNMCIVADCRGGRFVVRIMTMAEGEKLARKEGGLPV